MPICTESVWIFLYDTSGMLTKIMILLYLWMLYVIGLIAKKNVTTSLKVKKQAT